MITAGDLHRAWRRLPIGRLNDVISDGTVLILAPHPDDESLGCGGLIASCCAASRPPVVAILTDGSASHPGSRLFPPARLAALREQEARLAVKRLGLADDRLVFLRERDTMAPHAGPAFDAIVQRLVRLAADHGCRAVIAPWQFDPHCDHEAAALIGASVSRAAGLRLMSYPVWGWTLSDDTEMDTVATQGWRLDIAPHLETKRQAIAAHASQYGAVVTDDPTGFRLPGALLQALNKPWETFLLS